MNRPISLRQKMASDMVSQLSGPSANTIIVKTGVCDGCGDCVNACRNSVSWNDDRAAAARISIVSDADSFFPVLCHSCGEAPCATACMTGCRSRNEGGLVETDYSRCMGCGMCIMVCPFGAINPVDIDHKALKCDSCANDEVPACVSACRPGALIKIEPLIFSLEMRRHSAASIAIHPESGAQTGNEHIKEGQAK